ncbi:MAG: fatty acid desaturase [Bdellovibrionales bacterium]|nr:fatty acid desaturase [Bdellovibrionales bacterium]
MISDAAANEERPFEKIEHWRFYWDWIWSVGPILGCAILCEQVGFYFYPIAIYVIGNRFFRLATLGHEGLHHLISRNVKWNTFLARYLCHFPTISSHSRYKAIHLLHHRYLGEAADPDRYVYEEYPEPFSRWLKRIAIDLATGRIFYEFLEYYTELPERIRVRLGGKPRLLPLVKSDFWEYTIFWIIAFSTITYFDAWRPMLLYYFGPAYLHMPLIQLANGMQHGAFKGRTESRSQADPYWIVDFFIPLDLNMHFEHHQNPRVPHYHLRQYGDDLRRRGLLPDHNRSTLLDSLKIIFNRKSE